MAPVGRSRGKRETRRVRRPPSPAAWARWLGARARATGLLGQEDDRLLYVGVGSAVLASSVAFGVATAIVISALQGGSAAPSGAPIGAIQSVAAATSAPQRIHDTFDDLPMGPNTPVGWTTRGDAEIVASPTSVDRSLRLRTSTEGVASTACRAVLTPWIGVTRIQLSLLVEGATSTSRAMTMESGSEVLLTLRSDPSGRISGAAPAAEGPPRAGSAGAKADPPWQRVEIEVNTLASSVTWRAFEETGTQAGSGTRIIDGLERLPAGDVCLHSPRDAGSSWIALSDLVVE
jgi:hypothetical protein